MSLLYFFAKRFIAGETLDQALPNITALKHQGFLTTVDHLGENVFKKTEAKKATDEYLNILRGLKETKLDVNLSIKLTQLGLNIDKEFCLENLRKIGKYAQKVNGFVRVDAEGSKTRANTMDLVQEARSEKLPVGSTIQTMLRHAPMDLVSFIETNTRVRLCKGAYKEPVEVAFQDHKQTRKQYIALMKRLLTSGVYHGLATHDQEIIKQTKIFAKQNGVLPEQFEFQFLYGIRRNFAKKLLAEGWKVRIYCPFGNAWLPYILRRLRERKENIWFVIKHLFRK